MNHGRTLLIVDDSTAMRHAIARCCATGDDVIVEAANGAEAVEKFGQHMPDWTIMDIQMPLMDGLEAAREILQHEPGARVVIVTQHEQAVFKQAAEEVGACAFVAKSNLLDLRPILSGAQP